MTLWNSFLVLQRSYQSMLLSVEPTMKELPANYSWFMGASMSSVSRVSMRAVIADFLMLVTQMRPSMHPESTISPLVLRAEISALCCLCPAMTAISEVLGVSSRSLWSSQAMTICFPVYVKRKVSMGLSQQQVWYSLSPLMLQIYSSNPEATATTSPKWWHTMSEHIGYGFYELDYESDYYSYLFWKFCVLEGEAVGFIFQLLMGFFVGCWDLRVVVDSVLISVHSISLSVIVKMCYLVEESYILLTVSECLIMWQGCRHLSLSVCYLGKWYMQRQSSPPPESSKSPLRCPLTDTQNLSCLPNRTQWSDGCPVTNCSYSFCRFISSDCQFLWFGTLSSYS